jgi:hypothetical protein
MTQYSVNQCEAKKILTNTRATPDLYVNPTLSNMAAVADYCFSPCTPSFHSYDKRSDKISLPSGPHTLPQHISDRFYSVVPALLEDLRLQDFPQHAFEQFASPYSMGLVQRIRMVCARRFHRYLPNCLMDNCSPS